MKRSTCLALLSILVAIPACNEYRYQITMRRNADGSVQRELRYFVGDAGKNNQKPAELPEHVIQIYGNTTSSFGATPATVAEKSFEGTLPADVRREELGNFGSVGSSRSPMGEVFIYRERGPGGVRPWTNLKAIERALDTAISAWVAYAASQREVPLDADQLAALEKFLRTRVFNDAMDLALICWQTWASASRESKAESPEQLSQYMHRIILFLIERGYLAPGAWAADEETDFAFPAFEGLLRALQAELGGDPRGPLHPLLARLLEGGGSDEFEQGLCAIGLTQDDFHRILASGFQISFMGDSLRMNVTWQGQEKPIATNGEWDEASGELCWSVSAVGEPFLPELLYAVWSQPDEIAQVRLFGRVVLRDQLPNYNGWYERLDPASVKVWGEFVAGFSPEVDSTARLRVFLSRLDGENSTARRGLFDGANILLSELKSQ